MLVPKAEGHGNERIITAGRSNSVQFILNSLPSLIALSSYFVDRILMAFSCAPSQDASVYFRNSFT